MVVVVVLAIEALVFLLFFCGSLAKTVDEENKQSKMQVIENGDLNFMGEGGGSERCDGKKLNCIGPYLSRGCFRFLSFCFLVNQSL